MTLLTRIEKALQKLEPNTIGMGEGYDDAIDDCLELIRHLFAQPPTDEEVRKAADAIEKVLLYVEYIPDSDLQNAARAAITADRGK